MTMCAHTDRNRKGISTRLRQVAFVAAVAGVVLGNTPSAHATHFRYGNLSWSLGSGRTIFFQLDDAFRRTTDSSSSNFMDCVSPSNINTVIACTGPGGGHGVGDLVREDIGNSKLQFGDGTCEPAPCGSGSPLIYRVSSIDTTSNWSFVEAIDTTKLPTVIASIPHTYGGNTATFTAKLDSCCRISNPASTNGHINNPDKQYTLSTNVIFTNDNHAPVSTQVPIVNCCYPAVCTFQVPAADSDLGDVLTWRLATPAEAASTGTAFIQPGPPPASNSASISSSGLYTWNTANATVWTASGQVQGGTLGGANTTLYSTQVIIEDGHSKTPVDFLIKLVTCVNHKPVCTAPTLPQNVLAGTNLAFNVSGTDADNGDVITLNDAGLPAGATMTPALPTNATAPTAVSSNFSWTPTLAQVGAYIVQYSVTDQGGQQALCPVTINVTCSQAQCDDGNPCTDDVCTPNGCVHTNNTAPCSDGNACTQNDTCSGGSCQSGALITCAALDQCHIPGVCNPANGVCSNPSKPDGTSCTDGNACTQNDSCQAGSCTPGAPVVCTAQDQCHVPGVCNPGTGICTNPAANNGTGCNDGNACTQTDTCQGGSCTGSNPVVCTASDQCHDPGVCNPSDGQCSDPEKPNGTACNNPGNLCNQTNTCQGGTCTGMNPVVCAPPDQCHNPGTCVPATGTCTYTTKPNNTPCDDDNACSQTDTCQGGSCLGGNFVICFPSDQCHVAGACDTVTGICSDPPAMDGSSCNDGNACTQTDTCQGGDCTGTNPVICTALDQCHVSGVCDPGTGVCSNPNAGDGTLCDDSNGCTEGDVCTAGQCSPGSPKNCADPNPCTDDDCVAPTGTCTHTPNTNPCDDDNACTIADTCSGGNCLGAIKNCLDGNPCTDDGCDPLTGCTHTPNDDPCDDGNNCTTNDSCSGAFCLGGPPPNCNDQNPCTDDDCSPGSGCTHTNNSDACNDGNPCTTGDVCNGGACAGPTPTVCNDGNPCTTDSCNPNVPGGCVYTNNNDACNDQNACTTNDACTGGGCQGGPAPDCNDNNACTNDSCHTVNGCEHMLQPNCQPCVTAADCDNNNACDGVEKCQNGMCAPGTPPICTDTNPCTDDGCTPASGCFHNPNTAPCNDGNACTTVDACSGGSCQGGGPPPNCNDNNECTDDDCNPNSGCTHQNNTAPCNDGNPCTPTDVCHKGVCEGSGNPPACDDQNPCTDDACNPNVPGGCVHTFNTAECNDGNPCTVNDTCSNGACVTQPRDCSDNDVCTVDGCDDQQGNFLCTHTNCFVDAQHNMCPPGQLQCIPNVCGNGVVDTAVGESCDPPNPTPIPGIVPPTPTCRNDCTYCGDMLVQTVDGETCDDGNQVSGCDPARPTVPLDACQINCTPPICHDPAAIVKGPILSKLSVHGLLATGGNVDMTQASFVLQLSDRYGQVLFRNSVDAGAVTGIPEVGRFKYSSRAAKLAGGIQKMKAKKLVRGYRVTIKAYGDLTGATEHMVTHVFIGAQEWTVIGRWRQLHNGWRFSGEE